jgi:hypothetical protein
MKRISIAVATAAALSFAAAAFADKGSSCHFHGSAPAKEETVLTCAAQRKDALVTSGKLDASWKSVKHEKVEQIDGKKGKEWKVTFKNPAVADKDKQALYVFLSAPGNVLAANHTGN